MITHHCRSQEHPHLLAVSDLHIAHQGNADIVSRLRPAHPGDWLLVAGDVAEESRVVLDVLAELRQRFARVIWVPGNHELWAHPLDPDDRRRLERYEHLVQGYRHRDILTPEHPYPTWQGTEQQSAVVSCLLLYDFTFRGEGQHGGRAGPRLGGGARLRGRLPAASGPVSVSGRLESGTGASHRGETEPVARGPADHPAQPLPGIAMTRARYGVFQQIDTVSKYITLPGIATTRARYGVRTPIPLVRGPRRPSHGSSGSRSRPSCTAICTCRPPHAKATSPSRRCRAVIHANVMVPDTRPRRSPAAADPIRTTSIVASTGPAERSHRPLSPAGARKARPCA